MEFTGCSLVAAAGHPQALVGAVRLSLGLPLPFNHESRRNSGSQAEQGQEETDELQSRTGHRFQIIAGSFCFVLFLENGSGKRSEVVDVMFESDAPASLQLCRPLCARCCPFPI